MADARVCAGPAGIVICGRIHATLALATTLRRRLSAAWVFRQTSDAVDLSSGLSDIGRLGGGEGDFLVVVGAAGEAVVEAAEHAVEEVSLGGGVPVAGVSLRRS